MPEPTLSMSVDDDLPRTLRRERDARERAQREREAMAGAAAGVQNPALRAGPGGGLSPQPMAAPHSARGFDDDLDQLPAPPATVTAFDVPFWKLSLFLMKVVLAGIPALLLLGAILYGLGNVLQTFFPSLVKLKILISIPH